jgi:uncharacterized protein (TIGR02145 family)
MGSAKKILTIAAIILLSFSSGIVSGKNDNPVGSNSDQTSTKSVQTNPKTVQTKPKSAPAGKKTTQIKSKPVQKTSKPVPENKIRESGTVRIGTQYWALANLNVSTFRNGDSIPEAKTNKEWVTAGESGKPAWCYYNNNLSSGLKCGKLYNWYAVNDPRGLAPEGWTLSNEEDWAQLIYFLGGQAEAGKKLKSSSGWGDGNNGTNESGFTALPGGYRVENGSFLKYGIIGTWWSSTEGKAQNAIDHYLAMSGISSGNSPRQRGESVRCLRK